MARYLAQRGDMREIAPRRNLTMRLARDELYHSVQMQYQALEARLSAVEARLQLTPPERQASAYGAIAVPRRLATPSASRGYLLKDVDSFAGFAHAIHTYLAGVALADVHGRQLLYPSPSPSPSPIPSPIFNPIPITMALGLGIISKP